MAILPLRLIQEELLSASGEKNTGSLPPESLPKNSIARLTDLPRHDLSCGSFEVAHINPVPE